MDSMDSMPQLPQIQFAMSIQEMYTLSKRNDNTWGVEGYDPPTFHEDPIKAIKDRDQAKIPKGIKSSKLITKRGHFIDDYVKQFKYIPNPQKYDVVKPWVDVEKQKAAPKIKPSEDKNTYLDQIFRHEKKRGNPGTGKYNIILTDEQLKAKVDEIKKRKHGYLERAQPFSQAEAQSVLIPGPGNYNPRGILPKLHINLTTPKSMIATHAESSRLKSKSTVVLPPVGTYTPFPTHFRSFDEMLHRLEKKKEKPRQVKMMGLSERAFPPISKSSSAALLPGPGQYPLQPYWPGKLNPDEKPTEKKKNWMDSITKGISKSIYY